MSSSDDLWPQLIALYVSNLLNLISPGVAFALIFQQAAEHGKTVAFMTLFGILTSSAIHRGASLFGLNVLSQYPNFMLSLKLIGAIYLLLLSLRYYKRFFQGPLPIAIHPSSVQTDTSALRAYRLGFFTDLLNPQATIGFLALVASTLSSSVPTVARFWLLLLLLFTSACWYSLIILFVSHPFFKKKILLYRRPLDGLTAICLSFIGIQILLSLGFY
jgi:threonine/homoserine/homoserine lactone efflux protein